MEKKKRWTELVAEHDVLAQQGAGVLYDRVKKLMEICEANDFNEEMRQQKRCKYDLLDDMAASTLCTYKALVRAMEMFPGKEQWEKGRLNRMMAAVRVDDAKRRNAGRVTQPRKTVDWKAKCVSLEKCCATVVAATRPIIEQLRGRPAVERPRQESPVVRETPRQESPVVRETPRPASPAVDCLKPRSDRTDWKALYVELEGRYDMDVSALRCENDRLLKENHELRSQLTEIERLLSSRLVAV